MTTGHKTGVLQPGLAAHAPGLPCAHLYLHLKFLADINNHLLTFPAEPGCVLSQIPWQARAPGIPDQSTRFGTENELHLSSLASRHRELVKGLSERPSCLKQLLAQICILGVAKEMLTAGGCQVSKGLMWSPLRNLWDRTVRTAGRLRSQGHLGWCSQFSVESGALSGLGSSLLTGGLAP